MSKLTQKRGDKRIETESTTDSPTSSSRNRAISFRSCRSCVFCARLMAFTTSSAVVDPSSFPTRFECR